MHVTERQEEKQIKGKERKKKRQMGRYLLNYSKLSSNLKVCSSFGWPINSIL
jgi:hypothetical protein